MNTKEEILEDRSHHKNEIQSWNWKKDASLNKIHMSGFKMWIVEGIPFLIVHSEAITSSLRILKCKHFKSVLLCSNDFKIGFEDWAVS